MSAVSIPGVQVRHKVEPPLISVSLTPHVVKRGDTVILSAVSRGNNPSEGDPTDFVKVLMLDGSEVTLTDTTTHPNDAEYTYSRTWQVPNDSNTLYGSVIFAGQDTSGLQGTGKKPLYIDATLPFPPLIDAPLDLTGNVIWLGDPTVLVQGCVFDGSREISITTSTGATTQTTTSATGDWTADIVLPEGLSTLQATATDLAGNIGAPPSPVISGLTRLIPSSPLRCPVRSGYALTWPVRELTVAPGLITIKCNIEPVVVVGLIGLPTPPKPVPCSWGMRTPNINSRSKRLIRLATTAIGSSPTGSMSPAKPSTMPSAGAKLQCAKAVRYITWVVTI
ncbi:MAG: hypothetical protein AAF485_09660 [Chloroflexota bacterium]